MKALKRYQKHLGINQKQLAAHAGVSESQMSRWMKGGRVPNVTSLRKISENLGISMTDLLEVPARKLGAKREVRR